MAKEKKVLTRGVAGELLSEFVGYCLEEDENSKSVIVPLSEFIGFLSVRGFNIGNVEFSLAALVGGRFESVSEVSSSTGLIAEWRFDFCKPAVPVTVNGLPVAREGNYGHIL
jgi:hypothetical protein